MENINLNFSLEKCMYQDTYVSGELLQKSVDELQNVLTIYDLHKLMDKIEFNICSKAQKSLKDISLEHLQDIIEIMQDASEKDDSLVNVKKYLVRLRRVEKILKFKNLFYNVFDQRTTIKFLRNQFKHIDTEEDSAINENSKIIINSKSVTYAIKNRFKRTNPKCAV